MPLNYANFSLFNELLTFYPSHEWLVKKISFLLENIYFFVSSLKSQENVSSKR
uniref:Uncharacterized protein n=1 Tax=Bartonella schoenbuchensis (strain DSM 13525 / NCTC 13165 / R1) TaxID=687861 RepID=E6YXM5_BARSR|nr:hypothetical protein B11C_10087 [Bartonella schoenbuchensis R1]